VEELRGTGALIEAACDDVKLSLRLKKLLSIILKLGNELNQHATTGFTLESLLKLNTAKAFDKKTSILHYLVMLAERNDRALLDFKDDLKHVFPASRITLTGVSSSARYCCYYFDCCYDFKHISF
jgi:Formin Homology 2 Domain